MIETRDFASIFLTGGIFMFPSVKEVWKLPLNFLKRNWSKRFPYVLDHNVLLVADENGRFVDRAVDMGLDIGGWSWNAKFADIDNDEWQDIYIANGYYGIRRVETNYFYHNQQGQNFIDKTEEYGLTTLLDTASYTYIDIDNDGDLDIIVVPTFGPLSTYINNSSGGNSIAFELP